LLVTSILTERKKAENGLKASEKRFRIIFQQVAVGVAQIVSKTGGFVRINQKYCDIVGYTKEEMAAITFIAITHPDDIHADLDNMQQLIEGKIGEFSMEKRYIHKDGSIVWVNLTVSPMWKAGESPDFHIAVVEDITNRKMIEEELKALNISLEYRITERTKELNDKNIRLNKEIVERKKSENKYRELVDTTNTIPWESDVSTGRFTFIGAHAVELFGYPIDEWLTENFWKNHIHQDDREETVKRCMEYTQKSEDHLLEYRMMTADNNIIWVYDIVRVINGDNGTQQLQGVIVNITEHKKMEDALMQSEKLKSLGTITAGIAHDFNNILAVISGKVQLLEMDYESNKGLTDELSIIMKVIDDGAEISRRMLKFTKTEKNTTGFVSYDIRVLLMESIDFTMPRWKNMAQANGINYHIDDGSVKEVPTIRCNPTELREVFINIINNSLDAMPEGGRLSFSTWSGDDTVFVSISDTGEGIPENVKKRIFDPFFSTKGVAGTGLGMSMTYGIVTRHGGKIEVESEVGKGSTFKLQFPIATKTVRSIVTPEPEANEKSLRILVVDDEDVICNILDKFLSRDGHKVKTVDNGADAIELIKKEEFDLLLCDLAMPDVFGYDVIKAFNGLEKRPKIGIITGWAEKLKQIEEGIEVDFIIKKPFKFLELQKQINDLNI